MKKLTIAGMRGIFIICGFLLPLNGCKLPGLKYTGNIPPENPTRAGEDLAYGYRLIQMGERFPDIALIAPESRQERAYLGLGPDRTFSMSDISADLLLVEMLNVHCGDCRARADVYNTLFSKMAADPAMKHRVKMMAVGTGNTAAEIQSFARDYAVRFPIIADPRFELHKAVGQPVTPFSILIRLQKNPLMAVVALTRPGIHADDDGIYQDMTALMTLDPAVLRSKKPDDPPETMTIVPPQSLPEIKTRIQTAMSRMSGGSGNFIEFRKLAINGRHVYTGVKAAKDGPKRLFAEIISRPTICNVCHDVHFFYIFDQKGAVLDFEPLQLTKWGNQEWTRQDVDIIRQRLRGRFIFTPFYFNPELDAVTSATITSAIIFDSLSGGREVFEFLSQEELL